MDEQAQPGAEFARALAAKDFDRLTALFDPAVDFRGVTPRKFWEADDPQALVDNVLRTWFKDSDEIVALEKLETDAFADRERVGYRFRVRNPEGTFLIEQQLFISAPEGRITWMRSVCSGFRPLNE
jgi:hypothetical protein